MVKRSQTTEKVTTMKEQNNYKRITGITCLKVKHKMNHGLFVKEILLSTKYTKV